MEQEMKDLLAAQQEQLNEIQRSVDKTRTYILTMLWVSVAVVVLPLFGIAIILPHLMDTLTTAYSGLL